MGKDKTAKKAEFLSVRVSPDVKAKLEKLAESQERTLSWLVGKILEDYITERGVKS